MKYRSVHRHQNAVCKFPNLFLLLMQLIGDQRNGHIFAMRTLLAVKHNKSCSSVVCPYRLSTIVLQLALIVWILKTGGTCHRFLFVSIILHFHDFFHLWFPASTWHFVLSLYCKGNVVCLTRASHSTPVSSFEPTTIVTSNVGSVSSG